MKTVFKLICGLALVIGLLGAVGVGANRAHASMPQAAPQDTCKTMHQVAVVVSTGDGKFQRICVEAGEERSLQGVRAICNYTEGVAAFDDQSNGKHFVIVPNACQKFELDNGVLYA